MPCVVGFKDTGFIIPSKIKLYPVKSVKLAGNDIDKLSGNEEIMLYIGFEVLYSFISPTLRVAT